jgi:hypothetical protein
MGPHMKTLFLALFLATFSFASYAQTPSIWWFLRPVPNEGPTVGYIYDTRAVGYVYESNPVKNVTALRLICSTVGKDRPIIAVVWDTQNEPKLTDLAVEIKIDRKIVPGVQDYKWVQEGKWIYHNLSESTELIDAMKDGRTISFSWVGRDTNKRYTVFSILGFNTLLNDFYTSCQK